MKNDNDITIKLIVTRIRIHIKAIFVNIILVAIVMSFIMFSVPDYFRSNKIVGYEEKTSTIVESLHEIGRLQGYNLGKVQLNPDAIAPPHFETFIKSNDFLARLMQIHVTLKDGQNLTYYEYLLQYPQQPWWDSFPKKIKKIFSRQSQPQTYINPKKLTPEQEEIFEIAKDHFVCSANTKINRVTFSVIDQDPLVCVQMADSLCQALNDFMTAYRKTKIKGRLTFLEEQTSLAKKEYDRQLDIYMRYIDAHNVNTRSSYVISNNQMRLLVAQKELVWKAIKAERDFEKEKLEDRTSMFVTVQNAGIPIIPEGPQRGINIIIAIFLTALSSTLYFIKDALIAQLK